MPKPLIVRQNEDPLERAARLLQPQILPALMRLQQDEFTTREFIMYLRATEAGEEAYQYAVSSWSANLTLGRQIVHSQLIPALLRSVSGVEWLGYSYDTSEEDGLAVPSRWQRPAFPTD
jgi:hypothetical protein